MKAEFLSIALNMTANVINMTIDAYERNPSPERLNTVFAIIRDTAKDIRKMAEIVQTEGVDK